MSITLDATNVYFTTTSGLYSCPKTGCASPSLLGSAAFGRVLYAPSTVPSTPYLWVIWQDSPSTGTFFFDQDLTDGTLNHRSIVQNGGFMAADARNVYVGFYPGISAFPLNDPAGEIKLVSNAPGGVAPVAVDAANDYVYGGVMVDSGSIIRSYTLEAGAVTMTYVQNQPNPVSIAVAGGAVYWADLGTAADNYRDGAVYTCATGIWCASPTLLLHGAYCSSLTTDGSHVYFTCNSVLYRCPLSGCGASPTGLAGASNLDGPTLTNDASALYWVTEWGELKKLAK
jgi:hypothetical protein